MSSENDFYTVAFLKAFAPSREATADRESALLWEAAAESSSEAAERIFDRLNEEAARIASMIPAEESGRI